MQELDTIQKTLQQIKMANTVNLIKDAQTMKVVGVFITLYDENDNTIKGYTAPISLVKADNRVNYYINKAHLGAIPATKQMYRGKERYITQGEMNTKQYAHLCKTDKEVAKLLEPFIKCGYCC